MEFTEDELSLISQLRNNAVDALDDHFERKDEFLITWIRYKQFDIKKAEQALRNNKKWKKQNKLELLLLEDWDDYEEFLPIERPGFDKDGCPIVAMQFDKDLRTVVNVPGGRDRYLRYMAKHCEMSVNTMRRKHSETDGRVNHCVVLVNMDNYVFSQLTNTTVISTVRELVRSTEDNYPGILKTLYVINTPRMFKIAFEIVKPFFTADTLSRLKLFGCDKKQWRKALLENIEEDQLPSFVKIHEK